VYQCKEEDGSVRLYRITTKKKNKEAHERVLGNSNDNP